MKYFGTLIIFVLVVVVFVIYNILQKLRNRVYDNKVSLNSLITQRLNLALSLIDIVKNYPVFEEKTLNKIIKIKNNDYDSLPLAQKIKVDKNAQKVVSKILEVGDSLPELLENKEYLNLKKHLLNLEKEIDKLNKEFDLSIKKYNEKLNKIPNNLVAILFGFNEERE